MAENVEKVEVTRHDDREAPRGRLRTPAVDIVELEGEYLLTAEMPGTDRDGAEITVEDGVLTLRGTVKEEPPGKLDHQEFAAADFERFFTLSDDIDAGRITAEVSDGVLAVHLAKRETAKAKKIEIKSV